MGARRDRGIFSDDLLAFRRVWSGDGGQDAEVLADGERELGSCPFQVVNVAVVVDLFLVSDLEL